MTIELVAPALWMLGSGAGRRASRAVASHRTPGSAHLERAGLDLECAGLDLECAGLDLECAGLPALWMLCGAARQKHPERWQATALQIAALQIAALQIA